MWCTYTMHLFCMVRYVIITVQYVQDAYTVRVLVYSILYLHTAHIWVHYCTAHNHKRVWSWRGNGFPKTQKPGKPKPKWVRVFGFLHFWFGFGLGSGSFSCGETGSGWVLGFDLAHSSFVWVLLHRLIYDLRHFQHGKTEIIVVVLCRNLLSY